MCNLFADKQNCTRDVMVAACSSSERGTTKPFDYEIGFGRTTNKGVASSFRERGTAGEHDLT
jgi:hypothetical protein